jgi:hypothetical protein
MRYARICVWAVLSVVAGVGCELTASMTQLGYVPRDEARSYVPNPPLSVSLLCCFGSPRSPLTLSCALLPHLS